LASRCRCYRDLQGLPRSQGTDLADKRLFIGGQYRDAKQRNQIPKQEQLSAAVLGFFWGNSRRKEGIVTKKCALKIFFSKQQWLHNFHNGPDSLQPSGRLRSAMTSQPRSGCKRDGAERAWQVPPRNSFPKFPPKLPPPNQLQQIQCYFALIRRSEACLAWHRSIRVRVRWEGVRQALTCNHGESVSVRAVEKRLASREPRPATRDRDMISLLSARRALCVFILRPLLCNLAILCPLSSRQTSHSLPFIPYTSLDT